MVTVLLQLLCGYLYKHLMLVLSALQWSEFGSEGLHMDFHFSFRAVQAQVIKATLHQYEQLECWEQFWLARRYSSQRVWSTWEIFLCNWQVLRDFCEIFPELKMHLQSTARLTAGCCNLKWPILSTCTSAMETPTAVCMARLLCQYSRWDLVCYTSWFSALGARSVLLPLWPKRVSFWPPRSW